MAWSLEEPFTEGKFRFYKFVIHAKDPSGFCTETEYVLSPDMTWRYASASANLVGASITTHVYPQEGCEDVFSEDYTSDYDYLTWDSFFSSPQDVTPEELSEDISEVDFLGYFVQEGEDFLDADGHSPEELAV